MTTETQKTERAERAKARRKELQTLSGIAKKRMEADLEGYTVNEALIQMYREANPKIKEFKTLKEWNKLGFSISKGETAFLVWGRPNQAQEEQEQAEPQTQEDNEEIFYPVCYLFSNLQVKERENGKD